MTHEAVPIPLATRRILKKIAESPVADLSKAFKELPKPGESLSLFTAVLDLSARSEVIPFVANYVYELSSSRYDDAHYAAIVSWAEKYVSALDQEQLKMYIGWIEERIYKVSEIHSNNHATRPIILRLSKWFGEEPDKSLEFFKRDTRIFDLWSASLNSEDRIKIATVAKDISEKSLTDLFVLLSHQHDLKRSRGGDLENKPWLELMRCIWIAEGAKTDKIARCYIPGWRNGNSENGSADLMCELLDQASEPLKSNLKAAAYSLAVPYTQHLARKGATPIFDPVICYVIVKSSVSDELYGATKWAMEMADPGKLAMMVDVVVADIASAKSSVLRRLPAFFLMAGQLHDLWNKNQSPEVAEAMKRLARYWTIYRGQFERESNAENQDHYFKSNSEEVEKHMGKVLVRTQP